MSPLPPAGIWRSSPFAAASGPPLVAAGLVGLAAVVALLPVLGDERVFFAEQVLSYVFAIVPSGVLVYGLLALLDAHPPTPRLLLLGAILGAVGALSAHTWEGGQNTLRLPLPCRSPCSSSRTPYA